MEHPGLRERKKDATRRLLVHTALDLFEERGFDNVSVTEIATVAGVSKKTVFNYFTVKEDLVLGMGKHHIAEPATLVKNRRVGQTPHDALREYLLTALAERQPMTGLTDLPHVLRIHRLIETTPALSARNIQYRDESRQLLAEALVEEHSSELTARLVAAQILGTQQVLAADNARRIMRGETPDEIYPSAVAATHHAFRLIEHGLGTLLRRTSAAGTG